MFIAPIAKNVETSKVIAKSVADKLHEYVRYDAKDAFLPAIQKIAKEAEYFNPTAPTMQTQATTKIADKTLDIVA